MELQKIMRKFIVSLILSMLVICQVEFNLSSNGTNANKGQETQQDEEQRTQQKVQITFLIKILLPTQYLLFIPYSF